MATSSNVTMNRLSHDNVKLAGRNGHYVADNETVDLTSKHATYDNDDDDDMKMLIELGDLPPPPAQFQQQQQQSLHNSSRKSSSQACIEALHASNEIDLNDSISLHTSNNQTPVRNNTVASSTFEIRTYNQERTEVPASVIMSTNSAYLY